MGNIYIYKTSQHLPLSLETAWDFFSKPKNLIILTPPSMHLVIESENNETTYSGQIITHRFSPFLKIYFNWVSEITHLDALHYFIDEQRIGLFQFWHHQHIFKKTAKGVEVIDILHYKLPLGIIGKIAHVLFIKKKIHSIFEYRAKILTEKFGKIE